MRCGPGSHHKNYNTKTLKNNAIIKTPKPWLIVNTNTLFALVAAGGTILGSFIVAIVHALSSKTVTGMKDAIEFRTNLVQRIRDLEKNQEALEKKQAFLEAEIVKWKKRYFDLYAWLVNFCVRHGIDEQVPRLHEEPGEINETKNSP